MYTLAVELFGARIEGVGATLQMVKEERDRAISSLHGWILCNCNMVEIFSKEEVTPRATLRDLKRM